jgi:hypothetical protein
MPAEVLSGNLVVENVFYDSEEVIFSFKVRIHYV